jgi:DNA processing protein
VNYTIQHYRIALTLLYGVGPVKALDLIDRLGSVEPLFTLSLKELHHQTTYPISFLSRMKRAEALNVADATINSMKVNGINGLFYTDEAFPRRLRNCPDAPLFLYQKGNIDFNKLHWVSIVGTRNASPYGKRIVRDLIALFQGKNIAVVSGLALGIDGYVHKYCLEYDVPTVAVLGHGFDRIYPYQHKALANEITERGSLLTEFIPGTVPDRENFPKRNRIVAGMCDATIVVESKSKGGSLITAELANGYNRDVFAFPGSIHAETSSGCNQLIRLNQAHLIQSGKHFLDFMEWEPKSPSKTAIQTKLFTNLSSSQERIATLISVKPIHIDVLAGQLKIPISALNAELFNLEMDGVVQQLPGKMYTLY